MSTLPYGGESCILAWGNASNGQLDAEGDETNLAEKPKVLTSFLEIKSLTIRNISCGEKHTIILLDTGIVYSFGSNEYGQLGRSGPVSRPERIDALESMFIQQVACGRRHTLVLNDRGYVYAFGDNSKGQLGQHSLEEKSKRIPKVVRGFPSGTVLKLIACGGHHCLALSTGGQMFAWGNNSNGQLGLGNNSKGVVAVPHAIRYSFGLPIVSLAAGESHSVALTKFGTILCWGKNSFGQLGLNDEEDRQIPTVLLSLQSQGITFVVCGDNHTVALTKDGRVFAYGNNSSGQLGHNSLHDESIPRQIMELMGSTVTQIACGRNHTLALVSPTGKLYAFGDGKNGQLGDGRKTSVKIPIVINRDWYKFRSLPEGYSNILCTYGGGDQSFAVLSRENTKVVDMRYPRLLDSDLFIDESRIEEIAQRFSTESNNRILKRDIDFIERIFSSQTCLNGSFVKEMQGRLDSKTHCVHMPSVRRSFAMLASIVALNTAVCNCISERLIPSLAKNPPDVEALRVYIILPEFPSFMNDNFALRLTVPFGNCILQLSTEAQIVLAEWWKTLPGSFFQKTVEIFQSCVQNSLKKPFQSPYPSDEWFSRHAVLSTCMQVLKKLYKANEEGSAIPYTAFYIPEIQERIDIQSDFINWIQQPNVFSFCQYPFVFDTKAKAVLLQTDVLLQMRFAIDAVQQVNLRNIFSGHMGDPMSPMLRLRIRRDHLREDAIREITRLDAFEFKKPLKVIFDGEEGVDAGGVKKEFFYLLLREITDPKYGMFLEMEESKVLWFNHQSFDEPELYLLIGVICGLAIYNSTIIDLNFPLVLYKKLLGKKADLDDFRELQPNIARNLQFLLDYSEGDVETTFDLTFQLSIPFYGTVQTVDLIPSAADTIVNEENREQYVSAYIDYFLNRSIDAHFAAFSEGFHRVCSGRVLKFFHPQELMEMVVGCQDYDFHELEEGTIYKGEYFRKHPVIVRFWEVFNDFSLDDKKKFLAFLTGSFKVPIHGMRSLQFTIQPVLGGEDGTYLPVAHTCFNILDLPRYETKDIMKKKLTQAIEYSEGFGLA